MGLLSGSYDLGKADVASSPASTAFVVLNTMTLFTNQIFQASDSKEKGIIYAILLHIFALLFWTSAFRAILTDPGKVTDVEQFLELHRLTTDLDMESTGRK